MIIRDNGQLIKIIKSGNQYIDVISGTVYLKIGALFLNTTTGEYAICL